MNLNQALLNRMLLEVWRVALVFGLACVIAAGASSQPATNQPTTTANNLLEVPVKPVAIGHHGVGPNLGGDPTIQIENTVDSVRLAYSLGARVVEVDVQLTADGKLAVFHNDFLADFTCVDSLTIDQLQERMPFVPELHQVLEVARQANRKSGNALGGILIVELKALSPHCDPADNLEQTIVSTAVAEIHQAKMDDQVMFDSFSPALLLLASQTAPAIPRELDIFGAPVADASAGGEAHRISGDDHDQQEKFTGAAMGGDWAGVPVARIFFPVAISGDRARHTSSRGWRRNRLLRASRTATAGQWLCVCGGRTFVRIPRVCRSGGDRSRLEFLRGAWRGCDLQQYSAGCAVGASDSESAAVAKETALC